MKTQVLLIVLFGATCALAGHFAPGSNFHDKEKERHDTCKPLVSSDCDTCSNSKDSSSSSKSKGGSSEENPSEPSEPSEPEESGSGSGSGCEFDECSGSSIGSTVVTSPPEASGSGSGLDSGEWEDGEYCFLLQVFLNYSIVLDIEIREIFITWINITQLEIISNKNLTEYEMLVQVWYSLQIIFEQHVEIEIAIKYLYIGEWGYVCDLEGLAIDIQSANTEITIEQVIEIDVVTGTCPLLIALEKCKEGASSSEQAAIQILIQKIKVIITGSYSLNVKLVMIYQEFSAFFVQYSSLKVVIFNVEIEAFGIIQTYFDICNVYWRIDYFSVAVGGPAAECELIKVLTALCDDTKYSLSQRSDFKQLKIKIQDYFQTEVDFQLRIKYFSEQLYQVFILEEWTLSAYYSLEIKGYGSVYQLIYAYVYCINHGITPGGLTVSPPTTASTTTPTTTTTTKPTTTTTKPTTTKPNGNCGTVMSNNVVSSNITKLLSSIDSDQKVTGKWTSNEITVFSGYKKRIYSLSVNGTITSVQKFNSIKQVLLTFAGSTTTVYKKVHAVFIINWGTVAQYCGCSV